MPPDTTCFRLKALFLFFLSVADVFVRAINVQHLSSSRNPAQNPPSTLQINADAAASHVYQCQPPLQQQPLLSLSPTSNVVDTSNRHVYYPTTAKIFLPPYKISQQQTTTAAAYHVPVVYSLLPSPAEQICVQLNCESRGFECIEVFAMRTSAASFGVGAVCVRRRELVGGNKPSDSDPCQAEQAICNDNERCVAVFPDCRPFRSKRRLKCVPLVSCQVAAPANYLPTHNTTSSRDRGGGDGEEIYRDFVVPMSPSNINNDNAHSIDYASAVVKASQPFESSSTFFEKLDDSNQKQDNTTLQHQGGIALGPQFLATTLEVKLINSTSIMPFKE